jgi:hypothetical protein
MEILLAILVLLLTAAFVTPAWPYSAKWGFVPAGACGTLACLAAVLVLLGRI